MNQLELNPETLASLRFGVAAAMQRGYSKPPEVMAYLHERVRIFRGWHGEKTRALHELVVAEIARRRQR